MTMLTADAQNLSGAGATVALISCCIVTFATFALLVLIWRSGGPDRTGTEEKS